MVVVVPVDGDEDEAEHVDQKTRKHRADGGPRGTVRRTEAERMIVMITAITASLNASTRPVPSSIAPLEELRWLTVVHHKSALTRPDEVADLQMGGAG